MKIILELWPTLLLMHACVQLKLLRVHYDLGDYMLWQAIARPARADMCQREKKIKQRSIDN